MPLLPVLVLLMLMSMDSDSPLHPFKPAPPEPDPGPRPAPVPSPSPAPAPKPPSPIIPAGPVGPTAPKPTNVKNQPVPFPQVVPKDLPPFPAGWEPFVPPPKAVVNRAYQLISSLWKKGAGATTVEKTNDQWVTYQAFVPSKGKKGVAAFRLKPGQGGGLVAT